MTPLCQEMQHLYQKITNVVSLTTYSHSEYDNQIIKKVAGLTELELDDSKCGLGRKWLSEYLKILCNSYTD